MPITYEWRGDFDNREIDELPAAAFDHRVLNDDRSGQLQLTRRDEVWEPSWCGSPWPARAAKCEWLHVDFEDDLRAFYFDACGFKPTSAGLIRL